MIYLFYLIVAAGVVYLSQKASEYVDLIDKTTKLSGAFIGGIMLSAVTSLPELFTSVSATLFLNKPGLCMGNILGSNLFNLAVLGSLILIFFKSFCKARISSGHLAVTFSTTLIYIAIILNMNHILNFEIMTVSITSFIILALYLFTLKNLSAENGGSGEQQQLTVTDLTLKQIVTRFILVSIGIIVLSIIITYITDDIAERLNLGEGLAGAIFLGVATSLPEVSSTIALFRMKSYDIAIGNIIGSNIFNFLVLCIVDVLYIGQGIYDFSDPKTLSLLVYGAVATPLFMILLKARNKTTQVLCPFAMVVCYIAFLL
ncbi:sodium:calcium antiporter [Anaerosinus sp.]